MRIAKSIFVLSVFLLPPALAFGEARCRSDEVKTAEDAVSITCTKKSEIACVRRAGEETTSKKTQVRCAKRAERIAQSSRYKLTRDGAQCVASLGAAALKRGEPLVVVAVVTTCGLAGVGATEALDAIVADQNACFEEALEVQKARVAACKL